TASVSPWRWTTPRARSPAPWASPGSPPCTTWRPTARSPPPSWAKRARPPCERRSTRSPASNASELREQEPPPQVVGHGRAVHPNPEPDEVPREVLHVTGQEGLGVPVRPGIDGLREVDDPRPVLPPQHVERGQVAVHHVVGQHDLHVLQEPVPRRP